MSEGVLELIDRLRPGFVVVSGDLTQRAQPVQFQQARAFVDRIPVPSLVVPGNHDVPLYRVWDRLFDTFVTYKKFFSPELEPVYRDVEMLVVGINTAFGWTIKNGRITLRRLLEVEQVLRSVPDCTFKVVVAHHHLIPPPSFGTQRVLAHADEAIDVFSRAGVDLVLSGHLHQAYIGNSEQFYPKGRTPVVILHSGTTTSSRGRGGERGRNSCNWIEADEKSMVISQLRWHHDLDRFAEHSRHSYPRRERLPYTLEGPAL